MERQALQPKGLAAPKPPYSPVIVSGDLVYTSGQVPFDENGTLVADDFAAQVRQALDNLGHCLTAAGCGFEDVLKVTVYLNDMSSFAVYNDVYTEYFQPPYPARTTIGAQLVGFDIEIEAIARRPSR